MAEDSALTIRRARKATRAVAQLELIANLMVEVRNAACELEVSEEVRNRLSPASYAIEALLRELYAIERKAHGMDNG